MFPKLSASQSLSTYSLKAATVKMLVPYLSSKNTLKYQSTPQKDKKIN